MKHGWVGIAIGVGVGVLALYVAGGHRHDGPRGDDTRTHIAIEVATCDSKMSRIALDYGSASSGLAAVLARDPAKTRAIVGTRVAPVIDSRIATCTGALALLQRALASGSDAQMSVAETRMQSHLERLRRIKDVYHRLATSPGSAELEALDAAMN